MTNFNLEWELEHNDKDTSDKWHPDLPTIISMSDDKNARLSSPIIYWFILII